MNAMGSNIDAFADIARVGPRFDNGFAAESIPESTRVDFSRNGGWRAPNGPRALRNQSVAAAARSASAS